MYEYLEDQEFLKKLDVENMLTKMIKISVLDFKTEQTIAIIEGKATGGNINLNGNSAMRRVLSLSIAADPKGIEKQGSQEYILYSNINEVNNIISINKKIKVEIGFNNILALEGYYNNYDIIWIPLGTYTIKTASVSTNNSGTNISLTLSDKTATLNGDVGGTIPAATVFSETEIYSADASTRTVEKLLIKDIIKYLVVDFGGENVENIIIDDIPDYAKKVVKWIGKDNLYLYNINGKLEFTTEKKKDTDGITEIEPNKTFSYGMDCGFTVEPFYYPGKLECNIGETVSAMLDKIKNVLGNYEWFYDVWGRFHFQEKKNYINNAHATSIVDLEEKGYLSFANLEKTTYTFDASNQKLISSISSSPQYQNVKNDFVVWGSRTTASGVKKPIRYHLAFDTKPTPSTEPRLAIVYTDYKNTQQIIILKDSDYQFGPGEDKKKYYLIKDINKYKIAHWDEENQLVRVFSDWELCYLLPSDWRTELYFQGLENSNKTFAKNSYAAELAAEWPKLYDVKKNIIRTKVLDGIALPVYNGDYKDEISPYEYEYFLDFVGEKEGGSVNLYQFNVDNMGRRTKAVNENSVNCIFNSDAPGYIIVHADGDVSDDYAADLGYEIIQVNDEIYSNLAAGGGDNSAYDKIKELLIQNTHYNEAITLSTLPIYHLEPNTRIHIENTELGINGDYIINSVSLPLGFGTSNISCTKCIEKTI